MLGEQTITGIPVYPTASLFGSETRHTAILEGDAS